jgi:hypothetical protein
MLVFDNYFYKNEESKLYFGDRVTVLNDFLYKHEGMLYKCPWLRTRVYVPTRQKDKITLHRCDTIRPSSLLSGTVASRPG